MQRILSETFTTGYRSLFLYMISLISIFLGIYIIISKNPIFSVLFLIGLFFGVSIYLIIIGLHFIGLSYLLVYVGAVSILFLFILMLINVRISELVTDNKNSIALAILTVLSFNYFVSDILPSGILIYDIVSDYTILLLNDVFRDITNHTLAVGNDLIMLILYYISLLNIANVSSKSWDALMVVSSHITSIGNILYTNFFILFIIASLILLLAMVGAIVITINKSVKNG